MGEEPRRKRGVPLNDLDRSRRWIIGYTGRRWEVLGPAGEPDASGPPPGAAASGASGPAGRHAAPDAASAEHPHLRVVGPSEGPSDAS